MIRFAKVVRSISFPYSESKVFIDVNLLFLKKKSASGKFHLGYNSAMEWWIPITLFAAVMQVARTGCQKSLLAQLDYESIVWLRFGLALPLAPVYLYLLPGEMPDLNLRFAGLAAAAGATQVLSTLILVRLFARRNFAVCTAFSKTEAAQIALFGVLFFGLPLSTTGIIGVALGTFGVILMIPKTGDKQTALAGTAAGAGFALTAIFIKKAVTELPDAPPFTAAAMTLFVMLILQAVVYGAFLAWRRKLSFDKMWKVRQRAAAVGICGFLGSIGWASAFALAHPALVKTLAQVELPLAYLLGRAAFAEKPSFAEMCGMTACAAAAIFVAFA